MPVQEPSAPWNSKSSPWRGGGGRQHGPAAHRMAFEADIVLVDEFEAAQIGQPIGWPGIVRQAGETGSHGRSCRAPAPHSRGVEPMAKRLGRAQSRCSRGRRGGRVAGICGVAFAGIEKGADGARPRGVPRLAQPRSGCHQRSGGERSAGCSPRDQDHAEQRRLTRPAWTPPHSPCCFSSAFGAGPQLRLVRDLQPMPGSRDASR